MTCNIWLQKYVKWQKLNFWHDKFRRVLWEFYFAWIQIFACNAKGKSQIDESICIAIIDKTLTIKLKFEHQISSKYDWIILIESKESLEFIKGITISSYNQPWSYWLKNSLVKLHAKDTFYFQFILFLMLEWAKNEINKNAQTH